MSENSSSGADGGGDQLANFFLYSLFVYPVANYIVHPQRKYPKWQAITYAVIFFMVVAYVHLLYENSEVGPNHYEVLGVERDTPLPLLKKSFRTISLALHPDKNPDIDTTEVFRRVQQSYEVLTNKDKRREYNRLGDFGVQYSSQAVIDTRYILLQMIIYYGSSLVFGFLMTFSEPSGEATSLTIFGLIVMALVELLLVVKEVTLPSWFFPSSTPHDIVLTMHRLFPAYMNGCRCLTTAFYRDPKDQRVAALEYAAAATKELSTDCVNLMNFAVKLATARIDAYEEENNIIVTESDGEEDDNEDEESDDDQQPEKSENGTIDPPVENVIVEDVEQKPKSSNKSRTRLLGTKRRRDQTMSGYMREIERRVASEGKQGFYRQWIAEKMNLIENCPKYMREAARMNQTSIWEILRNFGIFLIARYFLLKRQEWSSKK